MKPSMFHVFWAEVSCNLSLNVSKCSIQWPYGTLVWSRMSLNVQAAGWFSILLSLTPLLLCHSFGVQQFHFQSFINLVGGWISYATWISAYRLVWNSLNILRKNHAFMVYLYRNQITNSLPSYYVSLNYQRDESGKMEIRSFKNSKFIILKAAFETD